MYNKTLKEIEETASSLAFAAMKARQGEEKDLYEKRINELLDKLETLILE